MYQACWYTYANSFYFSPVTATKCLLHFPFSPLMLFASYCIKADTSQCKLTQGYKTHSVEYLLQSLPVQNTNFLRSPVWSPVWSQAQPDVPGGSEAVLPIATSPHSPLHPSILQNPFIFPAHGNAVLANPLLRTGQAWATSYGQDAKLCQEKRL